MKITFIGIAVESLAIEFLSSYLKSKGHQVDFIFDPRSFSTEVVSSEKLANFFDIKEGIVSSLIKLKPDFVGFSVFTINYQRTLELASLIKKRLPKTKIILGGIHPTSVPDLVIKQESVDIVCVGEGEEALNELLSGKPIATIKNLWYKKNGRAFKNPARQLIKNLDHLPFPNKDIYYKIYPGFAKDYYTITSRGCPFACTYCANSVIRRVYQGLGPAIRRRTPENIIDELILAKKKYRIEKITFVDDVFVQDLDWLKKFASLYKKKINLPYAMLTHPKFVNLEITKYLVKSGCYFLLFGIQSASEKIRRNILERFETNQEIRQTAKSCHQVGLKFSIDHIFNIPGETVGEYVEAMHFYNQLRPSIINSYRLQFFPKTKIIDQAVKYRILKRSDIEKIESGQTSTSIAIGFGNRDLIDPQNSNSLVQFFFMLLPLIPQKLATKIINSKFYLEKISIPFPIIIATKIFVSLLNNRFEVYFGIAKSILYLSVYSLKFKIKNAK
jgi:radical SAM superfamily enzyme YgiQ (UPF0313 family)